ncbi:MAG: hypothetical protein COA91_00565 [Robiginitomaculum sp.]|nr:MAG: hypothetical protein COA91_00565 [Robiginitomaculum sp.]
MKFILNIGAAILVFGLFFGRPLPASAQISFGGDEPIDVKAERATYKGAKTVLSGDVIIRQAGSTILADRMDIIRAQNIQGEGSQAAGSFVQLGNISRIVAVGNFKYITTQNNVTGDKGVYERDKNIITVTGNVKFTQDNGNTVTGNKMIYDLTTSRARVDGNCSGRDCNSDERVVINIGVD